MSMQQKPENIKNPLPLRKNVVADFERDVREGRVLVSENLVELYDMANAAKAIVIERLIVELVNSWKSPNLVCTQSNFH